MLDDPPAAGRDGFIPLEVLQAISFNATNSSKA
jgi:hypothetical protein